MSLKAWVLFGAIAAPLFLTPERADACSPPLCRSPVRVFKAGQRVPGNQVHFAILADPPGPLSLHTVGGAEIAASIQTIAGTQVFAPDSPIAAGTEVELRYSDLCGAERLERQFRFSTYEAAPAKDFQVELIPYSKGILLGGDGTEEYAASHVFRIRLIGEDSSAVLHLVDYQASIDGQPLPLTQRGWDTLVQVDSLCDARSEDGVDSCGELRDVTPGSRILKLTTSTVGTETKPAPIELGFTIGCEDSCPPPPVEKPDAGVEPTDPSDGDDKGDQGADERAHADDGRAKGGAASDGCSVSSAGGMSSLFSALGLCALVALRRARWRRRD